MSTASRHILLWVLVFGLAGSVAAQRPADYGHQWVREHPLSIMALTQNPAALNMYNYLNGGMNTLLAWVSNEALAAEAAAANAPWHMHVERITLDASEKAYFEYLYATYPGNTAWQVKDEAQRTNMDSVAAICEWLKQTFPDSLIYGNVLPGGALPPKYWGGTPPGSYGWGDYLEDYMTIVQPELLAYDHYPFSDDGGTSGYYWYNLQGVRNVALNHGVPYGIFLQSYGGDHGKRIPSESDMRMQAFTHLAAGYKMLMYFTYDPALGTTMVDGGGGTSIIYDRAQMQNPELETMGSVTRFLASTRISYVRGGTQMPWSAPPEWYPNSAYDPHLDQITVVNGNDDKNGFVGQFVDDYGQRYFMLTNIWHGMNLSPAATTADFNLTFADDVSGLVRFNRITGQSEILPLTAGQIQITLPGGTADLFRYDVGHYFPGQLDPARVNQVSFRKGVGGYDSVQDASIDAAAPLNNYGAATGIGVYSNPIEPTKAILMKWPDLFANGAPHEQVPEGATIIRARLRLFFYAPSNTPNGRPLYAYPMLVTTDLGQSDGPADAGEITWAERASGQTLWGSGVFGSGPEVDVDYDTGTVGLGYPTTASFEWVDVEITRIVEAWRDGSHDPDLGLIILARPEEYGGHVLSSDSTDANFRPELVIDWAWLPGLPGDANLDQTVNSVDKLTLNQNWGTTSGATWSMGDFNGDGAITLIDLSLLNAHWLESY